MSVWTISTPVRQRWGRGGAGEPDADQRPVEGGRHASGPSHLAMTRPASAIRSTPRAGWSCPPARGSWGVTGVDPIADGVGHVHVLARSRRSIPAIPRRGAFAPPRRSALPANVWPGRTRPPDRAPARGGHDSGRAAPAPLPWLMRDPRREGWGIGNVVLTLHLPLGIGQSHIAFHHRSGKACCCCACR